MDSPWVWHDSIEAAAAGHSWPPQSTTMTVCIAVADIDESNGAEEIWPGSHHDLAAASFVAGDMLACSFCSRMKLNCFSFALSNENAIGVPLGGDAVERRRLSSPPARLCIPKGAVAFRDARLWHRVRCLPCVGTT